MATENDDFNIRVTIQGKEFTIDGMLVMAEVALNGKVEENQNAQLIEVVRKCAEPSDVVAALPDAYLLAIGLKVTMRLQQLGKALAP
jgi:hypothetical protein